MVTAKSLVSALVAIIFSGRYVYKPELNFRRSSGKVWTFAVATYCSLAFVNAVVDYILVASVEHHIGGSDHYVLGLDEMQSYMGIIVFGAVLVFTFVAVYDGSTRIAGIGQSLCSLALCGLSINQLAYSRRDTPEYYASIKALISAISVIVFHVVATVDIPITIPGGRDKDVPRPKNLERFQLLIF